MKETERLTKYVAELRYEDLPSDVVAKAKLAILDCLGVGICASPLEWSRITAEVAREMGGDGRATVWGHPWRTTAASAALVNGTAAHGIEMDDRSHDLMIHNGVTTIPAAVALAEQAGRSGRDLIVAVVCGYEVAYRFARASQLRIDRFTWFSIRSTWGAIAASAKVLELDSRRIEHALAIGGGMAAGLREHSHDKRGPMIPRLQGGGWPAQSGVIAALMAQVGFTGPTEILEGKYGGLRAFCTVGEPDFDALVRGLGETFEMRHWETKVYAARGDFSTAIEAVSRLQEEHGITASQVRRVKVRYHATPASIVAYTPPGQPASVHAAQFSPSFVVAAAFYHDLGDPTVWAPSILEDARVAGLCQHVEVDLDTTEDGGCDAEGPLGTLVVVNLDDGREVSVRVRHDKGAPENPLTQADVDAKFRRLSRHVLTHEQVELLWAFLDELDQREAPLDLSALVWPSNAASEAGR